MEILCTNLMEFSKTILRGKFIALNAYLEEGKKRIPRETI